MPDGGSWKLAFRVDGLSTDYTARNAYIVTRASAPPPPYVVTLSRTTKPEQPGDLRVERNVYYSPAAAADSDPWIWDFIADGAWPNPAWDATAGDFDLPGAILSGSGQVAVQLHVSGYSAHAHSLTAAINGVPVGQLAFEGKGAAVLTGEVAVSVLRATGNQLTLEYASGAVPGAEAGLGAVLLDALDLTVPMGAPADPAVTPVAVGPYAPALPAWRGVQYLIVTHPLFRAQAERIAALKEAEGLRTAVVDTDDAYDRFSAGVVEPHAIQQLVRVAAGEAKLRYVLLVGDDTFDPRDHTGAGATSFVPALYAQDAGFGRVPSENLYADVDGDGRPDVAIGRLPVTTVAEATLLADKIAAQATSLTPYANTHLFVADNSTTSDSPFRTDAEAAAVQRPDSVSVRWADLAGGVSQAVTDLRAGWTEGAAVTHYFGHGGFTEWADESLLSVDDPVTYGASWRPTVLFAWACLSQWHIDAGRSVNEALLFVPGGGAFASFGPVGVTAPAGHRDLADKVYAELYKPGMTVGEAIRLGKAATIDGTLSAREVVEGFVLLGDPALRLPRPTPVAQ